MKRPVTYAVIPVDVNSTLPILIVGMSATPENVLGLFITGSFGNRANMPRRYRGRVKAQKSTHNQSALA